MPNFLQRLFSRSPRQYPGAVPLSSVTAKVDDSAGWTSLTNRPQDYDPALVQEIYNDALTAWRKNPIAWRIIAITTDYSVGDTLTISSVNRKLSRFIMEFWHHPKNLMDLRLESMSDELARAGDLFVLLFRNPLDGMSYIRFVTKDRINKIESAPNDWETELVFYEYNELGESTAWPSIHNPTADDAPAIMLHYSVNRPLGALLGESDLTTMLPWLQRYSRMLEDRVRLHWAMRAFLWLVTVPTNRVKEKQEQYRTPPESGSIIVKDESETWTPATSGLHGADAQHDMKAVRGMIDAGSGYPPHWRGEAADANLATATAMQAPTERHLIRRQKYFTYILEDILYHSYLRSGRTLPTQDYEKLFSVASPDVSRSDAAELSMSSKNFATAMQIAAVQLPGQSKTFARLATHLTLQFAGEAISQEVLDTIMTEAEQNPRPTPTPSPSGEGRGEVDEVKPNGTQKDQNPESDPGNVGDQPTDQDT